MERYEKEVALTVEEIGCTLCYFEWKQSLWLSLRFEQAKSQHPPSADVQHGFEAYAHHQANIYWTLIISFVNQWRKTLVSYSFSPPWLSQYASAADPVSSGPSHGHSRPETKPVAGIADPKSTHMGCKSPSSPPSPQSCSKDTDAPLTNDTEAHDDSNNDDISDNDDDEYVVDETEVFDLED